MHQIPLPNVLIVDDDPLFRLLTRLLLESRGLTVAVADGCREALALLPTARPGLAIIDMVMPEVDGLGTIQALRSAEGALKFVACSGHDEENFRPELTRLGVPQFLAKPFTVEQLIAALERADALPPAI